jgi:hypothetical protein
VGTIRYTSVNSHLSIEQSRRDDLESFFYILIYMIKGKLPWQGLVVFDDETRMRKIAEMKCSISADKLTEGLSTKLSTFFKYVKKLKFNETPDYVYLIKLLHEAAEEKEINIDEHCFEWVLVRSFSIKSGSKSVAALNNTEANGKKGENTPTEMNHLGSNTKFNSFNYLGIPTAGITPKGESDPNAGSKGFNSKVVKVDSFSNINSKEEFGIIKELEAHTRDNISPTNKPQKALSGREIRTTLAPRPMSENGDLEQDDLSENYSQDIMDENVSNIAKKIAKTTLTTR